MLGQVKNPFHPLSYSFDVISYKQHAFTDNLDDYLGRAITRRHLPTKSDQSDKQRAACSLIYLYRTSSLFKRHFKNLNLNKKHRVADFSKEIFKFL